MTATEQSEKILARPISQHQTPPTQEHQYDQNKTDRLFIVGVGTDRLFKEGKYRFFTARIKGFHFTMEAAKERPKKATRRKMVAMARTRSAPRLLA
ncbi:MAG: hypothetical protein ACD_28C00235G0004 [uncultured bacterium]|nr:MAG: hypothetical protein ACD_28C00235G0004 [uncultured bacterium]